MFEFSYHFIFDLVCDFFTFLNGLSGEIIQSTHPRAAATYLPLPSHTNIKFILLDVDYWKMFNIKLSPEINS